MRFSDAAFGSCGPITSLVLSYLIEISRPWKKTNFFSASFHGKKGGVEPTDQDCVKFSLCYTDISGVKQGASFLSQRISEALKFIIHSRQELYQNIGIIICIFSFYSIKEVININKSYLA